MPSSYAEAGGYERPRLPPLVWFEVLPAAHPIGLRDNAFDRECYIQARNAAAAEEKFKGRIPSYRNMPCRVKPLSDGAVRHLRGLGRIPS